MILLIDWIMDAIVLPHEEIIAPRIVIPGKIGGRRQNLFSV
jgi:hypothetical protein